MSCEHCGEELQAKALEEHKNSTCEESPLGDVDFCGETVKRRDEEAHLSASVAQHLRLQRASFEEQLEKVERTR